MLAAENVERRRQTSKASGLSWVRESVLSISSVSGKAELVVGAKVRFVLLDGCALASLWFATRLLLSWARAISFYAAEGVLW